jgi:amino acid transporter
MNKHPLSHLLIGRPFLTAEAIHQSISKVVGLAVFASDALSSTAYATQEILLILALAGTGAFHLSIPISLTIAGLLVILTISYRQTIHAYPSGGGAYIVARDNLGDRAAQIAAAALLTDYILTVAVSIASGVDQIVSAVPTLADWRIFLASLLVVVMTIINLRGVKESGRIFAVPTYIFLGTMLLTLCVGFIRWAIGTLDPLTDAPELVETTTQTVTLFLILRAFSSGCTALTGVEAISNGIPAFAEPRSHNAAKTLTWMSIILGSIFISITFLANHIGATPSEAETVISQLGRAVWGSGVGQIGLLIATTLILVMAANTSFADFPRLAALAATDGFLPRQLAYRGSRLVFSWGITLLAALAILLLVVLRANTSRLIPLYANGVFLSFTLSQTGMVLRWRRIGRLQPDETSHSLHGTTRVYDPRWSGKMMVNGLGGLLTFSVMIIFAVTKFADGAWVVVILIPVLVLLLTTVNRHYATVASRLRLNDQLPIPVLPSPYRSISGPLREFILKQQQEQPNLFIHLLVGQLALPHYWEQALHRNTNLLVDLVLRDLDRVAITSVPYQIDQRERLLARQVQTTEAEKS